MAVSLTSDSDVGLHLQGLPFCVAGIGDLLALFRCVSCRYCFGTDASKPELLGAPGRVFTTQEVAPLQLPVVSYAIKHIL